MSRRATSTGNFSNDPKEYIKVLRKNSQVSQTSQQKHPVKAPQISVERELPVMGNNVWSSKSKNKPTASLLPETTRSSQARESRTWEKNSSASNRSLSLQNQEQRHVLPENRSSVLSKRSARESEYDIDGMLARPRFESTGRVSKLGLETQELSRSVIGSNAYSHGRPGGHAGLSATLSPDANSSEIKIRASAYQYYGGSSGSSDVATTSTNPSDSTHRRSRATDGSGMSYQSSEALLGSADVRVTLTYPSTETSDSNDRSNDRSQSASQQPKQRQHNPANCANLSPVKNTQMSDDDYGRIKTSQIFDSMASSSTLGYGSPENRKFVGTVSSSSASNSGAGAGVDATPSYGANSTKAKTGQSELWLSRASPGSSDVALIHTSATTSSGPSDANSKSTGRQSRTRGRTGATGLRSASQGLRNLGNTCYMNSILQCLAKVPWFKGGRPLKFQDDLLNEFFSLMKKMQENVSDSSLDPCQFRKQISALGFRFSSSEQNDAHEFLLCLLSRLSKTLKSERKPDLVADFLLGRQQNVIRFNECKHLLINEQPFFSLSLPLTSEGGKSVDRSTIVELQQCLENYTKIEDVDGDALCMECQAKKRKAMQPCSIEASLKCLPRFLMIHLKRYDFMRAEKLENKVLFPHEKLEIKRKEVDQSGKVVGREEVVVYDLIAVCNHYGSLRFGHYTADIKSPSNWYNYSDSRVRQTPTEEIGFSRDACILFYQQSD